MVTQAVAWGRFNFIDRQSVLVNEDGGKDDLDPDLTAALQSAIPNLPTFGPRGREDPRLSVFLREVLTDIGVGDMSDLDTTSLTELLQGILED